MTLGSLVLGITAIFIPPLAVFWRRGCSVELLIDILLLILGWIPGVIYAWYVILESPTLRQRRYMRKERKRIEAGYAGPPMQYYPPDGRYGK